MSLNSPENVVMLDIRADHSDKSLLDMVLQSLNPPAGNAKTLPTLVVYDERGLKLFEQITYLHEYYLTNAEINALELHADEIARRIPRGTRLIELGSGNLRKVDILLRAFERAEKEVEYFALDLSLSELNRTVNQIDTQAYKYVAFNTLHGTYDDGLAWLGKTENKSKPTCILTLGSSIGNFSREEGASFLAAFAKILGPADNILVGLDGCHDSDRVWKAYNDSEGVTEQFYRNGLDHVNRLLGYEAFKQDEWDIEGLYDEKLNKHHASYVAKKDISTKDFSVRRGEKLHFEDSFKYTPEQSDQLWHAAGLVPQRAFGNKSGDYYLHLLTPAGVNFPDRPSEYASKPVPSLDDWRHLWTAWDMVTKSMVPRDELLNKPIQLRNNLIFYLGHIPTFADIHFTKATGSKPIEPAYYYKIFERGIDPDVENPDMCHAHSEIPDTWPPLNEILNYQARVRERITESIQSGRTQSDRRLARGVWLAYEHEAMHLETFLYMLLQSDRVIRPPGEIEPDFATLAKQSASRRVANLWHHIPATKLVVGIDDPENDLGPDRFFGWDNERPSRTVAVKAFEAQGRPISNGEYARYLEVTNKTTLPASWTARKDSGNGFHETHEIDTSTSLFETATSAFIDGKAVRTVYGPVALRYVLDWPVMASYNELAAYASWANGRIPTFEEVKSIYALVESNKASAENVPSSLISAVNGHLCNNGVQETPPSNGSLLNGAADAAPPNPQDLFIDLTGRNVGFKHWHPTPVTHKGDHLCGQSDVGGLWEWTSTPLAPFEGFKAMDLYPGYTADFFDDKHNICLGGSWATVPRIAGKQSFINWYQKGYLFMANTARIVRDID